MCGIAGILSFSEKPVEGMIQRMTNAMAHRGPDADGFYCDQQVALGHRRLSIIDLSAASNQPFADSTGRYQMVFNGELYNFQEVKAMMRDHVFKTSGDTEVLVEAFARWGVSAISKFKGMFSFAIWDTLTKSLTLVRDRLGVKPLYYYQQGDLLLFASELRALLKTGLVPLQIDESAIKDYLTFQSISAPYSIIQNIQQLEAAHILQVNKNGSSTTCYWDITTAARETDYADKQAIQSKVFQLLSTATEQRLISDVPIGAFLSGGIDSSAVVALMKTVSSARPNTFTVAFDEKEFDESAYAAIVAKKFNTEHVKILLKPSIMLDELEHALDAMDSPSADGINSYVVSKAVKHAGLTVALSGIGGDELFAGYANFERFLKINRWAVPWKYGYGFRRMLAGFIPENGKVSGSKAKQLLNTRSAGIDALYPVFRRVLTERQINNLVRGSDIPIDTNIGRKLKHNKEAIEKLPLLSQMTVAELFGYTQQTLLKDTDQMSMAVSLEVREPFFDHQLVEYVLGIPDTYKFSGYPKQLLVESLGDLLPAAIVHRKKQGFVFPWNNWLKKDLRAFCETHIHQIAHRPFINGTAVLTLWNQFLNEDPGVRWVDVWLFVVLNYWLVKNVDN